MMATKGTIRTKESGPCSGRCGFSRFAPSVAKPSEIFPARGTVTLVALCFVSVLGIALASYLAVCTRAMQLSNRSFQGNLSQQLAEAGIEEALRAFNKNDWSGWASNPTGVTGATTAWSLDTTNKRATRTLTFTSGKLGQNVTATVKVRVDNYDANAVGSTWVSSGTYPTYNKGDLVGSSGLWYRCIRTHSSTQTPTSTGILNYWVPAPIPWTWDSNFSYSQYDVAYYPPNNSWYYSDNNSNTSTPPTNWTQIPTLALSYNWFNSYNTNSFVFYSGSWHRAKTFVPAGFGNSPTNAFYWENASTVTPSISFAYRAGGSYTFNDVVYHRVGLTISWYRCIVTTPTGSPSAAPAEWENGLTGTMHGWNASLNYNIGDVVYHSGTSDWYRCIKTNSGQTPAAGSSYWANTPLYSTAWESGRQYTLNDTVRYNGVWYRYINGAASSGNLPTNTTYWIGADTATVSHHWNATTSYAAGSYKCYGGVWYKCTTANSGQSPNNTAYWTPTWANAWAVTTGAPVVYAEGTVSIAGSPAVKTQLRATLAPAPLFPNAAGAITSLTANGSTSSATVDSYDSTTGSYGSQVGSSTNFSAVLAVTSPAANTDFNINNTQVKGFIAAPSDASTYAPLWTKSGSAVLTGTLTGIDVDLTRVSRSPNVPQVATWPTGTGGLASYWGTVPKGTALALSSTINIGTPGATTPSRYNVSGDLTIDGTTVSVMNINGPVILYIQGDLTLGGATANVININSTGSAEIHVGDGIKINQTSGGIVNKTLDPKKLILIGDTFGSETQNYTDGDNDFYGVIYLPNTTNPSGFYNSNSSVEIYGAVSAKKITYSGADMNIHYDTSLRHATFGGVDQPWAVSDWRVLPATEQATMP
jgi:hypothetical protein